MKYLLFDDISAARAYCDEWLVNLPLETNDVTRVWDIPKLLTNGKFVCASWNDAGSEWNSSFEYAKLV